MDRKDRKDAAKSDKSMKAWKKQVVDAIQDPKNADIVDDKLVEGGNAAATKAALLSISSSGTISDKALTDDLKNLSNNKNKFSKLNKNELDLIQKLLVFRGVD